MRLSKKLLYSAMALTMLTGATIAPVAQIASGNVVRAEVVDNRETYATPQETTKVNIYKLQGADFSNHPDGVPNKDGAPQDLDSLKTELGKDVKYLSGVTFRYYEVIDYKTPDEDLKKITTVKQAEASNLLKVNEAKDTIATDGSGLTSVNLPSKTPVKYLFVEVSNDKTATDKVVGYTAVPFVLHLPVSNSNGQGYFNEINIFPKNTTVNEPKVDKDVTKLGKDDDSYQIGQNIKWYLKSTVPANIDKLDKFAFTDTLNKGLSFAGNETQTVTKVQFGNTELTPTQDYNVIISGTKLTVSLTEVGIKRVSGLVTSKQLITEAEKLYAAQDNTDTAAFLSVEVNAKLNEEAVMGKRIENKVELDYGHESDTYKSEVPTHEVPEVHTGGARFVKVDAQSSVQLSGAEFGLYTDEKAENPLMWTEDLLKANNTAIQAGKFREPKPVTGTPIVFKSVADGSFEIKGLKYGNDSTNTRPDSTAGTAEKDGKTPYYIKELVAPKDYVVSQDIVKFEVSQTSYYQDPTKVDVGTQEGDATPKQVKNNKRPEIPNTGGIGTAIFVVLGIVLMVVATKGMRSHKEEN
ncbi:SpaH/EbpB family LPXTG-anchored major pilin [Streptococcus pyogenes]|uniref:SpaH/EbpB family LPXTG-anchored major pilin n=1 Tax=Streptococcus pyogenes TaxID=1314 RepID=UPI00109B9067|nr:SpaH/EbpB family LPXTG-anchored major pilin [Streptococcus pyogenes]VGR07099.1 cell wall surface anchor family protein [Streptococcus pyogenes]VHC33509.1 cell wall surface anchor family protein [Streptococcus pyogenes]VHD38282.1 cell wall surface anchor family protein [Streptococcus pyogenes]HER5752646.1 SpaH/EbpB family LPXTG-anchored major pilin [Streptococcus pyogenes]